MRSQDSTPDIPLLHATGVSRRYGSTTALHPTDFAVRPGEAVAVIGENGAGKSTLAKILTGAETPDEGTLTLGGRRVVLGSPRDALQHGIALIPQELAYVPQLTVAENVMLNRQPGRYGLTSRTRTERAAAELMTSLGMWVDPAAPMAALGVSDQQVVELVKALGRDSRLLVLDEPTAALTEDEATKLYGLLAIQRARGVGVVLISHHLEQVSRHVDRIDVFRDGRRVYSASPSTTPRATFIQEMLGAPHRVPAARPLPRPGGRTLLALANWVVAGRPGLRDVCLDLREGEVVGVYGIRGSGAELLAEGLGGQRPQIAGSISVGDQTTRVFASPTAAIKAGVAYVPADRKRDGLVLSQSISTSTALLILRRLARWGLLSVRAENAVAHDFAQRFGLRYASLGQPVGQLSGGNQQKVLLASRLAAEPLVVVAHEPTRGVDIGARREIHEALRSLTRAGTGVLVVTSDVEEVVEVSDRVLVIRDGRLVAELTASEITQDNAVHHAAA